MPVPDNRITLDVLKFASNSPVSAEVLSGVTNLGGHAGVCLQ